MAVKFDTNIAQLLHFPFGDAVDKEGQFGPQKMYTVNLGGPGGAKDYLFASLPLHRILQSCPGGLKGVNLWFTKKEGAENRKFFVVVDENGNPLEATGDDPVSQAQQDAPAAGTQQRPPQAATGHSTATPVTIAQLERLMGACLKASANAWEAAGIPCTADNVQGTASTMFIQAVQGGILRPAPAAAPAAGPAPGATGSPARSVTGPPPRQVGPPARSVTGAPPGDDAPPMTDDDLPF